MYASADEAANTQGEPEESSQHTGAIADIVTNTKPTKTIAGVGANKQLDNLEKQK